MRDFCLTCYALLRGGSRNFWLGGSRLWFRKDCRTFLWQITSNRYDHILWYVNPGRHWYWKYCFASRGERIIKGYPKTKLHFWISLEFSIVRWQNAMRISLKKIIHLKSDTASCWCKNISLKQATGLMGGGGGPDPPLVLPLLPGFNLHLLMGNGQRLLPHFTKSN